jgi:hypothetical protein
MMKAAPTRLYDKSKKRAPTDRGGWGFRRCLV